MGEFHIIKDCVTQTAKRLPMDKHYRGQKKFFIKKSEFSEFDEVVQRELPYTAGRNET